VLSASEVEGEMNNQHVAARPEVFGAVMVIGAGIAGMQSSLDLANSGYLVYLVERNISIGGVMAQLDKTFPTNDCSTCMISPKLIEVAHHPNIRILTRSEVEAISGEPGRFQVTLLRRPRYVDEHRCTACGECGKVCPITVPADFNRGMNERKAIYRHFPQAIPAAFAIDKRGTAPCKAACPAGISVQGYVALIAQGRYQEALDLVRKRNPLPGICGRVCHHPCETVCSRGQHDQPVAIDSLKRFIADWELQSGSMQLPETKPDNGGKVAIVGGGPAGLSAGYYLALEGYRPTIFESMPQAGGWMRYGIPEYRLPKAILDAEIDFIRRTGVEIVTERRFGQDFHLSDLERDGFEATFLAIGAQRNLKLNIPGEGLNRVFSGTGFLRRINLNQRPDTGRKVAVIGGGNCAMDAARSALRMDTDEVHLFYRRSREEMPANVEEILEAEEEGLQLHFLAAPIEILGDAEGNVRGIQCIRMELGEADESGRRRPVPIEGSEYTVAVDSVISAVGLMIDLTFLDEEPEGKRPDVSRWSTVVVDPVTYQTSLAGVFAGGDAATGAATVIQAIAAGREVAISIDRYLRGEDLVRDRMPQLSVAGAPQIQVPEVPRTEMPRLSDEQRKGSFAEVQLGFTEQQARDEAGRCLGCGVCSECYRCVDACLAQAVNHDMAPRHEQLEVGAVLVATGFQPVSATLKPEYGYGRYPNVITSLEFERMLAASGPTTGHIQRPGDGRAPRHIAWIQCVGSRDASIGQDYCSSVCCMYATKQAIVTRDHEPEVATSIFFIDLRAMGKGFERYVERAQTQHGVRYVRSHISRIIETTPPADNAGDPSGSLEIHYLDETGQFQTEVFDMVILSVGLKPTEEAQRAAAVLQLETDRFGFLKTLPFDPTATGRQGIYACGVSTNPMDIPETVAQASAAAAAAESLLAPARNRLIEKPAVIEERSISGEIPRIGVFVCHCGINIAGVVDVAAVADYARGLPNVVYADHLLFTCATDSTERIKEIVKEQRLNRVVVASCSPRTHESLFQDCIHQAGLNKYLFEMANIRDQCSWVHGSVPDEATEKSKDLVRMAIAKALFLEPLYELPVAVQQSALVIGGGAAGMTAAINLADQGFSTHLVEREPELGGEARRWIHFLPTGEAVQPFLSDLIDQVKAHPNIVLHLASEALSYTGHTGHFSSRLQTPAGVEQVEYGALVVAVGADEYQPHEYLFGQDPRVLSQRRLHAALATEDQCLMGLRDLVMIQCVGSRDAERPYCSRVCCTAAVANALAVKARYPEAHVTILYRDIRTFGTRELLYKQAREQGVRFCRYDPTAKPEVEAGEDGLKITVFDQNLQAPIQLRADLLALSTAMVPRASNQKLAQLFKLSTDADGFFMEAHVKLRPLDFATPGLYLCGIAHSPKFLDEAMAQAKGAASRAATILSKQQMLVGGRVAVVDPARCAVCLTCVRTCPYEVPKVVTSEHSVSRAAYIDPAACQGCGACAAECPAKAIRLQHFTDPQLLEKAGAAVG